MSIHKRKLHAIGVVLLATLARPVVGQYAPQSAPWTATFGAMGLLVPRYEGADEHRLVAVPFIQMTFRDRLYLGPTTSGLGGVLAVVGADCHSASKRRDIGRSRVWGHASRIAVRRARRDRRSCDGRDDWVDRDLSRQWNRRSGDRQTWTGRRSRGLLGARLGTSKRFGRMVIRAGISATLADAREMRRAFGVTEEEAGVRQSLIDAGDSRLGRNDGSSYKPGAGLKLFEQPPSRNTRSRNSGR